MKKLHGYTVRLKKRSQLPILHKKTLNNIYVALDFKTNGTYEVICNSNGSQKSEVDNKSLDVSRLFIIFVSHFVIIITAGLTCIL